MFYTRQELLYFRFLGFFKGPTQHTHSTSVENLSKRWEWVDPRKRSLCWPVKSWWFDFSLRAGNCLKTILQLPGITSSCFIWICVLLRNRAFSSGQCRTGRTAVFPIKTLSLRAVKSDLEAFAYDLHMMQFPELLAEEITRHFFRKHSLFW